jgi:hypothetical protein
VPFAAGCRRPSGTPAEDRPWGRRRSSSTSPRGRGAMPRRSSRREFGVKRPLGRRGEEYACGARRGAEASAPHMGTPHPRSKPLTTPSRFSGTRRPRGSFTSPTGLSGPNMGREEVSRSDRAAALAVARRFPARQPQPVARRARLEGDDPAPVKGLARSAASRLPPIVGPLRGMNGPLRWSGADFFSTDVRGFDGERGVTR